MLSVRSPAPPSGALPTRRGGAAADPRAAPRPPRSRTRWRGSLPGSRDIGPTRGAFDPRTRPADAMRLVRSGGGHGRLLPSAGSVRIVPRPTALTQRLQRRVQDRRCEAYPKGFECPCSRRLYGPPSSSPSIRDQRAQRARLRAHRGRGGARRGRGAPRPLGVDPWVRRPLSRGIALRRHHAGDGRRGAPSRARARAPRTLLEGRVLVRTPPPSTSASSAIRARGTRVARPCFAPSRWRDASRRSCAGAGSRRSRRRWGSRSTSATARCPTPRRARASSARCSPGCARTRRRSRTPVAVPAPARRSRAHHPGARRDAAGRAPAPRAARLERAARGPGVYLFRDELAACSTSGSRWTCARARAPTSRRAQDAPGGRRTRQPSTRARRARSSARCCSSAS